MKIKAIRLILFLLVVSLSFQSSVPFYSVQKRSQYYLAPISVVNQLYLDTLEWVLMQHRVNQELLGLWIEIKSVNLDPYTEEGREEIFEFSDRGFQMLGEVSDAYLIFASTVDSLRKMNDHAYGELCHLVVLGSLGFRIVFNLIGKNGFELVPKRYAERVGKIPKLIFNLRDLYFRTQFLALILAKRELLNLTDYYEDPEFMNLDRLYSKPNIWGQVTPELLREIEQLRYHPEVAGSL